MSDEVVLPFSFGFADSNLLILALEKGNTQELVGKLLISAFFPPLSIASARFLLRFHYLAIFLRFETSFTLFLLLRPEAFKQKCYMDLHQM